MLSSATVTFLKALSRLLGWIYTISWSLSFWPQPWLNYKRKTTAGTTPAFPFLNIVGFTSLSLQTTAFYYSPLIRAQYRARNDGAENTNQLNDVAFAIHGFLLCWITSSQFWSRLWGFKKRQWRVGKGIWGIIVGCLLGLMWAVGVVLVKGKDGGTDASTWAWIDVVYGLGSVKLTVTVIKYIPQAWANYQRKSTAGWSISQILMDFIGGILSIAQLVIDASLQSDWSGIRGHPVKFGLGNISIFFDVVFMVQHYILYRGGETTEEDREARGSSGRDSRRPLLADEEDDAGIAK